MRISAFAACLAVLAALGTCGCHDRSMREFEFTLNHDRAASTVQVDCKASSSGRCHFIFTGDKRADLTIGVGDVVTVTEVSSDAKYCAAAHSVSSDSCQWHPVPYRQAHVSTRSTTDSASGA